MNYAAFKSYLATFLWKQNDTDLIANLDSLILMANAELNRVLDIQRRDVTLAFAPDSQDHPLPSDFRHVVSLNSLDVNAHGGFSQTTELDIHRQRAATQSGALLGIYAVSQGANAKTLRMVAPFTVTTPGSMLIVYRANVPNYATTDLSWLADDFLDLYTYVVLSHTAPFLREDERVSLWDKYKNEAIATAIQEDRHGVKFGGSPLLMQSPHAIPSEGRRR